MKIDHYINRLLYQYDCVIVPELGGFVANYKPATIHPLQNTFRPPSKGISFNKNLNKNDGLLANFIVQNENINYSDSCKKIEEYVLKINQDLALKKRVLIEEVGVLFLDAENRTQFDPQNSVNYLLDSYGLPSFQKLPIKRTHIEDKITKEFKDRTMPIALKKENGNRQRTFLVAAAIATLFFLAIWIPSNYDLSADLNYANLTPFNSSKDNVYNQRTSSPEFNTIEEISLREKIAAIPKSEKFITHSFIKNEDPIVVQIRDFATKPISTYVSPTTLSLKYHIVGGCFSEKSNAKKMVKQLQNKGFKARIIGKRKGLWTVSYGSFKTRKEAIKSLHSAKEDNVKAWVLNQEI